MKFLVCWPDYDPDSWTEIDAYDAELAAKLYAERVCEHDNECYSSFEHGEFVAVKEAPSDTGQLFTVTMEMVPSFSARPMEGK